MLNVLVVEQQQKQVQYLELLKQHEATEEAAKASTQQKEAEKEPKESLPQQQQEIVDLTVSKNKEENHRTHETTTTTEEKVQSETWIEEKIPSSDFQYPISYFIHSYSNMYSSMASLKTTSIFWHSLISIFFLVFGKIEFFFFFWGSGFGYLATWVKHANWEDKLFWNGFFFCSVFGIIIIFYTRYISIFMVSDSQMVCLKIVRVIFYLLFTMDE